MNNNPKYVMLSFDTEEFDVPRERNVPYTVEQGMVVSRYGTEHILDILKTCNVHATFFCTLNFVKHAPDIIERIKSDGHEIASHGCDHWQPKKEHVYISKPEIERLADVQITGYRQPRMFAVDDSVLHDTGYLYNASLNPACIPGKYIHLTEPRRWFMREGVMQIPASVTPLFRIPLFWLALHNFPLSLYLWLVRLTLRHDGYFNTYFHPWEFYPLGEHPEFKTPYITHHNAGNPMCERLKYVIDNLKADGAHFITYNEFYNKHKI